MKTYVTFCTHTFSNNDRIDGCIIPSLLWGTPELWILVQGDLLLRLQLLLLARDGTTGTAILSNLLLVHRIFPQHHHGRLTITVPWKAAIEIAFMAIVLVSIFFVFVFLFLSFFCFCFLFFDSFFNCLNIANFLHRNNLVAPLRSLHGSIDI